MNDLYLLMRSIKQFLTTELPARSVVEVARLPRDVKVEIEVIVEIKV